MFSLSHPWKAKTACIMPDEELLALQTMIYGIQTVKTAVLISQDTGVELHVLLAAHDDGDEPWHYKEKGRGRCLWWKETGCMGALTEADFDLSGVEGFCPMAEERGREFSAAFGYAVGGTFRKDTSARRTSAQPVDREARRLGVPALRVFILITRKRCHAQAVVDLGKQAEVVLMDGTLR